MFLCVGGAQPTHIYHTINANKSLNVDTWLPKYVSRVDSVSDETTFTLMKKTNLFIRYMDTGNRLKLCLASYTVIKSSLIKAPPAIMVLLIYFYSYMN